MSSSAPMKTSYAACPAAPHASRSTAGSGSRLGKKPPLAPVGTMSAFFTIWALTSPSTSVRKSSRRSDQRRPPRATEPNRRWTPSTTGECTHDSSAGRGLGRKSSSSARILKTSACGGCPSVRRNAFVRCVARSVSIVARSTRSASSEDTAARPASTSASTASAASARACTLSKARSGSNRISKASLIRRVSCGCEVNALAIDASEYVKPAWRRYFANAWMTLTRRQPSSCSSRRSRSSDSRNPAHAAVKPSRIVSRSSSDSSSSNDRPNS